MKLIRLLLACNNSSSEKEENNTVEEIEEPYVDPVKQEISTAFPSAYQFFSNQDSSFDASKFEQMSSDTLTSPDLKLSEKAVSYSPLFIYNADSSYAIDLYSYNIVPYKRNGKTILSQAGPDTEVAVIDLKNKTSKRIYFGGSSSAVLDAKWISNGELFLLTGEVIGADKFQPQVLQYKTFDNTANNFVYSDTLHLHASDYTDRRLQNL